MDKRLLRIITLATRVFGVPISFVSVLDSLEKKQYFFASRGLLDDPDGQNMAMEDSICQYVQASLKTIAISELLKDARTRDNAFIVESGLRPYLGSPIHTTAGKVIGAMCCMSNSPREWTQDEIDINEDSASCVDDITLARTSALEERKARTELQEIMAARSGFIAHVGHEIRTPITAIVGSVKMLENAKSIEQSQRLMEILNRSTDKLMSFVNDVFDLTELDARHFENVEDEVDIGALASNILYEFGNFALGKSISLYVKDQLVGNTYLTDKTAFEAILKTLIGNAVKFTGTGSVTVSIGKDAYGQVAIDVSDTGIGIAPEYHEKIFKDFEQAGSVTARTFGGTGLSMSIVKRIVDRMEGTIGVKSQLGQRSTFSVLVPLQIATRSVVDLPRDFSSTID